ncbi:aldehyde dehydrogenase family protein [bacterium]|nr:aldehyde dehydrogenase family protein [bacterium]
MGRDFHLFVDGQWIETGQWDEVKDKWSGEVVGRLPVADEATVERALEAGHNATNTMAELPAHQRASILEAIADGLQQREEEIATMIALEAGKSWKYALGEASRARETFIFAAGIARTLHGETVPMDASSAGEGRFGFWYREPVGLVAAITPFNFPLNLVAHKVAPAIAAGCPLVLKPAGTTPLTALLLAEIVKNAGLPKGGLNVIHGSGRTIGAKLVTDPRPRKITFTGSREVGTWIKQHSDLKRVTLELGNNSAVVVDKDTDLELALERCLMGAFANSGQVCISVQRIYLHEEIAATFTERFVTATKTLRVDHPLVKESDIGPLISPADVDRTHDWVQEAVAGGATLLAGGQKLSDRAYAPTVLTNTTPAMKVSCDEVFAPVVVLETVPSFEDGLRLADDTDFGLQAGVFTSNLQRAFRAIRRIHAGGVMVNDVPTFRVDHMPYGGMRASGIGREGVRFAVDEMTEIKMVMIRE